MKDLAEEFKKPVNKDFVLQLTSFGNSIADFEFLINILRSTKEHVIVYAGGLHCEKVSQWLKNLDGYGYNLITDLGFNVPNVYGITISHRAWDYLLEKPIQSFNNYKRHGNRPFINVVTEQSDVFKKFVQLCNLLDPKPNTKTLERLQLIKNIFNPRSDTKILEQLQQFFKKADTTFVNFIEARIPKYDNQTLLFATVNRGLIKSTDFLLKHGARANVRDDKGQTPLFYAGPYPEIVKLLLESGADTSVKNNAHQSVIDYLDLQANTTAESRDLVENKPPLPKETKPKIKPVFKKPSFGWYAWLEKTKRSFARWIGWSKSQPKASTTKKTQTTLRDLD
ncbi:MAG: ankyrin repeat domain-containing protein [Candidatus Babeliaceae bacterium]